MANQPQDRTIGLAESDAPVPKPAAGGNQPPKKPPVTTKTGGTDDGDSRKNDDSPTPLDDSSIPLADSGSFANLNANRLLAKNLTGLSGIRALIEQTFTTGNVTVEKRPVKNKEGKTIDAYVLTVPIDFSRKELAKRGFSDSRGAMDAENNIHRQNSN
ncbi:MAG: hypothetical protein ACK5XN_13020, partial [Bacteroidota bacterium]